MQYIIQFCFPDEGYYIVTHSSLPDFSIFVKKGPPRLVREARTQAYFYDQAQQSPNAPCVARVYEVFADGQGSTFLVMEFISAPSFEALIEGASSNLEKESIKATAFNEIANAVEWLLNCPVPEGVSIGPVGGGYIQHLFFHMEEARVAFVTVGALEAYVNKVRSQAFHRLFMLISLLGIVASTRKNQAHHPTRRRTSLLFSLGRRFQELPLGWQSALVHRLAAC